MRIDVMLGRMVTSKNPILNAFGARWAGKLTTRNLQQFYKDWNKLMVNIQKHKIEEIKNIQDEMFGHLIKASNESRRLFTDITVLVEEYIRDIKEFVHIMLKEIKEMKINEALKKELTEEVLRGWNNLKRTIDNQIRAEYQRLLEVVKVGEVNGEDFMEKWRNLTKGTSASYINYYIIRNEYNIVKNDLHRIKKLSHELKVEGMKIIKHKEDVTKVVKEIKKGCKNLFNAAMDGTKNAYGIVQRDIIYAFIMLDDVKKLAELDKELALKHDIPEMLYRRVEEESKAFEQQVSNVAKEEAFVLQREVRGL